MRDFNLAMNFGVAHKAACSGLVCRWPRHGIPLVAFFIRRYRMAFLSKGYIVSVNLIWGGRILLLLMFATVALQRVFHKYFTRNFIGISLLVSYLNTNF
jgi:hypothetical protein